MWSPSYGLGVYVIIYVRRILAHNESLRSRGYRGAGEREVAQFWCYNQGRPADSHRGLARI